MTSPLPVAILAGGMATRLRPVTATIPKALVEVAGEPFVSHQLRLLCRQGVQRVVLCAGYRGEMLREYVGDGRRWGVEAAWSFDGEKLLGTGGALKRALPLLGEAFVVLYGDSYLPCDLGRVVQAFRTGGRSALMTVFRNHGQWDVSNVEYREGRLVRYDKKHPDSAMQYIDYGLGVFRAEIFRNLPEDTAVELAEVYRELVGRGDVAACEVSERFYEVGSFEGLEEFRRYLAGGQGAQMSFSEQFLGEAATIAGKINREDVERLARMLADTRSAGGRLFILGVGGSAANASHAVNDFRKLAGFEAYAPTDNVSELTARTNDEGWAGVFEEWLKGSRLASRDAVLVFSVGGGNLEKNVSPNLVVALKYARSQGARVGGIVGRDGGYTAQVADACVIIPTGDPSRVTPHAEAFQAVVWHLLVSHPALKTLPTKWESVK